MTRITRWLVVCSIITGITCASNPHYYPISQRTSEQIIISERVGEVIDAEERTYYNLFQGISGFQEAVFFRVSNYGFDAVITTDAHTYVYSNRDSVAVDILREYIERYEDPHFMPKMFEQKWKVVAYDDLGFAISHHEISRLTSYSTAAVYGMCGFVVGGCIGFYIGYESTEKEYDAFCGGDVPVSCHLMITGFVAGGCGGWLSAVFIAGSREKAKAIQRVRLYRQPQILE